MPGGWRRWPPRRTSRPPARKMRELQGRWRSVALAPRTQGEAMWRRFKTAQDAVFARTSAYIAAQHEARDGEPAEEAGAVRACGGAGAVVGLGEDGGRTAGAAGGVEDSRRRGARSREGALGALPRGLRRVLQPPSGGSEEAQGRMVRQPGAEGSAVRGGRAAGPIQRLGRHGGAVQAPAGRSGRPSVRCAGRSPRSIWQRFRTACDGFFERYKHRDQIEIQEKAAARTSVIQDLEGLVAAGGADAAGPRRALRHGAEGARRLAACARSPACAAAGPGRAVPRRAGAPGVPLADGVRWYRPGSRQHAQAHGEAAGARGAAVVGAGRIARAGCLAGGAPGPTVARTAGRRTR